MKLFYCFLVSVVFFPNDSLGVSHSEVDSHSFCYTTPTCGPAKWPDKFCQSGKSQSPIDIPLNTKTYTDTTFKLNKAYTKQYSKFYGINNGHTVQFTLGNNLKNISTDLSNCGGELPGCYKFGQLHFHWGLNDTTGSEHTLNKKMYPMELHIVHYKDKFASFNQASMSGEADALAVIGILYTISSTTDNAGLANIFGALPKLQKQSQLLEFNMPINIGNLYPPKDKLQFARYKGSLTTPDCNEIVIWTVFTQPLPVSMKQMMQIRKIENALKKPGPNFRPIQPLNGRPIKFYKATLGTQ